MGDVILFTKGITKAYSGQTVLNSIDIEFRKGEIHALLGENGAGKSTLIKILTGIVTPNAGEIYYKGKRLSIRHPKEIHDYGIGIVYQEFNLMPDLTVAQNIFIAHEPEYGVHGFLNEKRMNQMAAELLKHINSDLSPTRKVETLSVAEQQMVEIAKALSNNCEVLIMDEPTAALTNSEIDTLFGIVRDLRDRGVAIIYISHRMSDLDAIVDRVTVLRDGEKIATHDYSPEIKDQLICEMVGRELSQKFPPRPPYQRGEATLRVSHLNRGKHLQDISFTAYRGEILGIAGLMGAGRTELARAIFGADRVDSGEIEFMGKKLNMRTPLDAIREGIGYITEDRKKDGLMLNLSLKDNMMIASYDQFMRHGFVNDPKGASMVRHFMKKLSVRARNMYQTAQTLSGGNQQKVVVSKWMMRDVKLLIFDEPTRGIDVKSKYEMYELMYQMVQQGITVIMISSEMPEVLNMSDRILVICEGRVTAELDAREADQEMVLKYAMP